MTNNIASADGGSGPAFRLLLSLALMTSEPVSSYANPVFARQHRSGHRGCGVRTEPQGGDEPVKASVLMAPLRFAPRAQG